MKRVTRGKVLSGAGGGAIIAQGSYTHAAGTIAGAGGTVYAITTGMTGVQTGDFVTVAVNYPVATRGSATWRAFVSGSGTVSHSITNAAGTCIWSAGTVQYRVERPS